MTGDELRRLRTGLGLTQRAVAAVVGVERPTVTTWERRGARRIRARERDLELLACIARVAHDQHAGRELAVEIRRDALGALAFLLATAYPSTRTGTNG